MANGNLYDRQSFFQLIIDGKQNIIEEPVNWDKITIELPRDKDGFGFNFEFVDDAQTLVFSDDNTSYDLVKKVYDTVGSDGIVIFQYGYYPLNSSVQNVQYTGKLNLNTYSDEDGGITCSVEKTAFENLFKTRYETAISLNSVLNLDNGAMVAPEVKNILLHSKKISKAFKAQTTIAKNIQSVGTLGSTIYVQLDSSDEVTSEVQENQAVPLALTDVDPRDESRYFFLIKEAGDYTLKVQASFDLVAARGFGIISYNFNPRLMVQRGGVTIENTNITQFQQSGSGGNDLGTILRLNFNFSFQLQRSWQVDDRLYLDVYSPMGARGYNVFVSNYLSTIELLGQTTATPTITKGYRAFDALNKMIEAATGQQNALISSIFGAGGALYKTFITNGYAVRNFIQSDKPIITNLQDFIVSFAAVSGLGYGYTTRNGVDKFIIEPLSFFYRDKAIQFIDDIYDYREDHAKELVFNEFEIGYEKYSEEEINTLDEFNTYQTGLTPIKTYKGKFTKKSKYITSGYSLEVQRRQQFQENPSESLKNDDDIFLISCNEGTVDYDLNYEAYNISTVFITQKVLIFDRPVDLIVGDVITIKGGNNLANDGKTFTITSISVNAYRLSGPTLVNDSGPIILSKSIAGIQAEKDELFTNVSGLFSPETSYNLRFSPKRMLYNWANYLNIGFTKKPDTDFIKTSFVKNNDKMISLLSAKDVNRRNEPLTPSAEFSDASLEIFRANNKDALHLPVYCYFKSQMSYDDVIYIKQRLTGESQTENDYGYVYHYDDKGVLIKGYVYSLKYNPAEEVAEFQTAKIGNY